MRYWKRICACSALVLCLALLGLLFYLLMQKGESLTGPEGGSGNEGEEIPVPGKDNRQEKAAARLMEFAEVIYQYDTAERKYYEGAEKYLTDEAYREFVPFGKPAGDANAGQPIHMRSELLEAHSYFSFTGETSEALLESRFTLSQGGRGYVVQYLKLSMEEIEGEWFITSCRVLDTIEQ